MALHRRDDHVSRELQKALVEATGVDGRPFREERHLVQQLVVLHESASAGAGDARGFARDHVPSLLVVGDYVVVAQQILIRIRARHLVRPRRPDTQPPRDITRPNTCVAKINNLAAEHRHEPSDRSREAPLGPPLHRLREGQRVRCRGQEPGQHVHGRATLVGDFNLNVVVDDRERGHVNALRSRKPRRRFRGRTVVAEGDSCGRTGDGSCLARLGVSDALDDDGHPTRGRERARGLEGEARGSELALERTGELDQRRQYVGRGDLLHANLKEKVSCHQPPPPFEASGDPGSLKGPSRPACSPPERSGCPSSSRCAV